VRFANQWLRSIFVDRKKVAYFAAGSLTYGVVVTFVHLGWAAGSDDLPAGYYGPYLMVLSGLLFYLDAQFKLHTHRHAFLSHFTFLVYGLSIAAVLLALDGPAARLLTLGLATVIYGMVLAKYLTLVPLYLMVASLAGLYAYGVLAAFPTHMHFLLAIPGLYALGVFSRWAARRGAEEPIPGLSGLSRVGLATYRVTLMLMAGLAAWSLGASQPGLLAATSGLVLAGALWWLLRSAPGPVFGLGETEPAAGPVDLLEGPWLYAPVVALALGFVFLPRLPGLPWATQLSLASMLLGLLWVALMVLGRGPRARRSPARGEVFANSAVVSVLVGTVLAGLAAFDRSGSPAVVVAALALGVGTTLWLSLDLYVRWLFYGFLLEAGAFAVVTKLSFFPEPSVGLGEMTGVAVLWVLVWSLERQPDRLSAVARRRAWRDGPRRLLWRLPGCGDLPQERGEDPDPARAPREVRETATTLKVPGAGAHV
jgi:hypothetical protein